MKSWTTLRMAGIVGTRVQGKPAETFIMRVLVMS